MNNWTIGSIAKYSLFTLLIGGVVTLFAGYMNGPFSLSIWAVSPYAFYGLVVFGVNRFLNNRQADMALFISSLLITGLGVFYYLMVFVISPNMESNLGLIFAPIYQYVISFLLLTVWFLTLAITKLIRKFAKI